MAAKTMFEQLGGMRRLKAMLNAREAWYKLEDNGDVMIRFRFSGAKGMNVFTMTLNAMDTYDMEWWYTSGGEHKRVKVLQNMYHDDIIEAFESVTGLVIIL